MSQSPDEMVVTPESLTEAAQRITDHLQGKEFQLVHVNQAGRIVNKYGTLHFKECVVNSMNGYIKIIPEGRSINVRILWPRSPEFDPLVLKFLPDRLEILDAPTRFEYRIVKK